MRKLAPKSAAWLVAVSAAVLFSACSEKDVAAPIEEQTSTDIAGVAVSINNDAATLSKYVTNYKANSRNSRSDDGSSYSDQWSMPVSTLPDDCTDITTLDTNTLSQVIAGNKSGAYLIPKDYTLDINTINPYWPSVTINSSVKWYIAGTLKTKYLSFNGAGEIYILDGGTLTVEEAISPSQSTNTIAVYDGGTLDATIGGFSNGASLYVDGSLNLNVDGSSYWDKLWYAKANIYVTGKLTINDTTDNGVKTESCTIYAASIEIDDNWSDNGSTIYTDGDITVNGYLITNNSNIYASTLTVSGDWTHSNNGTSDIGYYIYVTGDNEINAQPNITTKCYIVDGKMTVINNATLNVNSYIKAASLYAYTQLKINMGASALIDAGELIYFDNKEWSINFDNDESTPSVIKATKWEVMEGNITYIEGHAQIGYESFCGKDGNTVSIKKPENVNTTVTATILPEVDDCKPSVNYDPDEPYLDLISHIDPACEHTHEISSTCIYPYAKTGKAYVSWQKRGTSIHGCLEALEVNGEYTSLTSWMETTDDTTEGGNNWNGNSAISGADELGQEQGEYDFNHMIVVNEDGINYVVTVGDNEDKGGFLGALKLDNNGNFGKSDQSDAKIFTARQLLASEAIKADVEARSGNCVVYTGDKYLIACAGGFQEYTESIADLGIYESESTGAKVYKTKLGNYSLTNGSAKHIALSSDATKVATLELNQRGGDDTLGDYWFNDITTVIPATLKYGSTSDWLNVQTIATLNICPIYGKNVIAVDNDNVYVSAGIYGVQVYNNSGLVDSWKIADYDEELANEYTDAAVNGLCVTDQYVYLAYGSAGLWVLNKTTLRPVCKPWITTAKASANYVAVDADGNIYVAYGRDGVKVLQLK